MTATAPTTAPTRRRTLGVDEIARLLPHRYPFALLDRVIDVQPGVSAEGIKNISASDVVLSGHFPGRMIYPGVLLVECLAQLAAVIYGTANAQSLAPEGDPDDGVVGDVADRVGYLAEIKQAKFLRPVVPGDQLALKAQAGPRFGALMSVTGQASVGAELALTARLTVTERENDTDPEEGDS